MARSMGIRTALGRRIDPAVGRKQLLSLGPQVLGLLGEDLLVLRDRGAGGGVR